MAPQPKTIQQIGLGTFEQGPAEAPAAPYTQYWQDYSDDYLKQLGLKPSPDLRSDYHQMSGFVSLVADILQDEDHRLNGLTDFPPNLWYSPVQRYGRPLKSWDYMYGHFNMHPEAQPDLLTAAGLVLQENAGITEGRLSKFSSVLIPEKVSLDKVLEDYPVAEQDNGSELFLAAELIHKAGWLAADYSEQQRLFRTAETIYDHLTEGTVTQTSIRASGYLQDVLFYQVQQVYQQGAGHEKERAIRAMRQLIGEAAVEVASLCEMYRGGSGRRRLVKGLLLEHFVPLLLRDTIVTDIERGLTADEEFFSVRHAFSHEDMSPSAKTVRPGFDVVVQRFFGDDEVATTPLQLKFSNGENDHISKAGYLPGIVLIKASQMSYKDIADAAVALKLKYKSGSRKDVVEELDKVQSFRKDLLSKSKAA